MLDLVSVHAVSHLIRELRAAGRNRDLIDAVVHRLSDSVLLQDEDLRESLEQMRRGEGRVLRPKPS
jgi:SOS response regulatory protein OraA/RecX